MVRSLLLLLICTSFSLFANSLFAKDDFAVVYLTWQHDPTSTMTVQWMTKAKNDNNSFYYREKGAKKGKWQELSASSSNMPQHKSYLLHRIEVTALKSDQIYQCRMGKNKKVYSFRTMPKDLSKSVRFVVGGDAYHSSFKRFKKMCKRASSYKPRFAIIGGDIAYAAPSGKKQIEDFKKWKEFFGCWMKTMVDDDGCMIPLLTTIGNHEVKGGYRRTEAEAPYYYAFFQKAMYDLRFGDYAHLIFLDTDHTRTIKGAQTDWLAKVLKKNQDVTHRFATYHVGAFPSTGDFTDPTRKKVRKFWVPLFEWYGINACFENHDHAYKRTFPLIDGWPKNDGVIYFGEGAWGVKPRAIIKRPYLAHTTSSQQVLVVELSKQKRLFWAIDPKGKVLDRFEQPVTKK